MQDHAMSVVWTIASPAQPRKLARAENTEQFSLGRISASQLIHKFISKIPWSGSWGIGYLAQKQVVKNIKLYHDPRWQFSGCVMCNIYLFTNNLIPPTSNWHVRLAVKWRFSDQTKALKFFMLPFSKISMGVTQGAHNNCCRLRGFSGRITRYVFHMLCPSKPAGPLSVHAQASWRIQHRHAELCKSTIRASVEYACPVWHTGPSPSIKGVQH